jgi:hypothetical protein
MIRRVRDRRESLDPGAVPGGGLPSGDSQPVPARGGVEAAGGRVPDEGDLFLDYLRLLGCKGEPHGSLQPEGSQLRTCSSCGRRVPFHLDPEGSWAWCSACGRAA